MHIILRTPVRQSPDQVWAGFDRTLFDRLSPPFPPVDVVRFDGCLKGFAKVGKYLLLIYGRIT
ncbi:MAG: hypothetical protein EOO04_00280 [Chitinophagaceae bacterium]|nr:MAG: hypothetical protein EOO04_00280 [Chitinophagaceae bacterium]